MPHLPDAVSYSAGQAYPYPRWDETDDERDKRLETSYEYTRTYPVTLIYTDAGWRFDAFTTPNQADMQLLGEWDGVGMVQPQAGRAGHHKGRGTGNLPVRTQ